MILAPPWPYSVFLKRNSSRLHISIVVKFSQITWYICTLSHLKYIVCNYFCVIIMTFVLKLIERPSYVYYLCFLLCLRLCLHVYYSMSQSHCLSTIYKETDSYKLHELSFVSFSPVAIICIVNLTCYVKTNVNKILFKPND